MKPHPRIRKTVKWGGAVVSALLVVVWVASGWLDVRWEDPEGHRVSVHGGEFWIARGYPRYHQLPWSGKGISMRTHAWSLYPQRPLDWAGPRTSKVDWMFSCALWFPASIALLAALTAWHLDTLARRRTRIGLCPKCSYNRTGLPPASVCPECGAAAPTGSAKA